VNFAGSGGAVIGLYDGDPGRLEALRAAYAATGARLIVPEIVPSGAAASDAVPSGAAPSGAAS
jgi:hypothetical protein